MNHKPPVPVWGTIFLLLAVGAVGLLFFGAFSLMGLTRYHVTPVGMLAIVIIAFASILLAMVTFDKFGGER
jgi:hypothetical protein